MKANKWIVAGLIATTAAVLTVWATSPGSRTLRTYASITAVYQTPNPLATNTDVLAFESFAGHDLVNLALGSSLETDQSNNVLALDFDCGSSAASLVVFDKVSSSNIVTIAQSTSLTALTGQDNPSAAGPNHERFVMNMDVKTNGFLIGGSLTIAGRVYLTPSNGCPATVTIDTDKGHDKSCNDASIKDTDDKDKDKTLSGAAHLIGLVNVIFLDGSTNTVLLPDGQLTMHRILLSN